MRKVVYGIVGNAALGVMRKPAGVRKSKYRKLNNTMMHRVIVEQRTGLKLKPEHIVHHVDPDDKLTNEGLFVVCESQAYHALLEIRGRALRECGNANWLKCKVCGKYDDPVNLIQRPRRSTAAKNRDGHFDVSHVLYRGQCVDKGTPRPKNYRAAKARDEGIWRAVSADRVRCVLCGHEQGTRTFSRAAHAKKHVREGTAVARVVPAPPSYRKPGTTRTIYEPKQIGTTAVIQQGRNAGA